jgi:hypothetical protein
MTRNLDVIPPRFVDEVPTVGLVGDITIAGSGQMVIGGPVQYVLVPYTNVATIGMSKYLYGYLGPASVASGHPVVEIHKFRIPTVDDFRRWREEENVARQLTKEDRARLHINTFLGEVYSLAKIGDTDAAGYRIFDFLDRALCDGFFAVCDEILSKVEVEKIPTSLMRSFLSITAPAKRKLPARAALYKKIEQKMIELRGEEKTRRIIGNLA